MAPESPPQPVVDLAEARAVARRARDWPTADRLLAAIEAAGWKVVDAGTLYSLERGAPPDVVADGITRYGSSTSVPSRLLDEPVGVASIVMVAEDECEGLARSVRALVDHVPDGTQLVIVANGLAGPAAAAVGALALADPGRPDVVSEVVWTSARLGAAAARNAGIRRAAAPVVILLDPGVEPAGDLVSPLVAALADHGVGVAGPFGMVSADMRRFLDAPQDAGAVDAIRGSVMAFRRADYVSRGPLDEHFVVDDALDAWWSLVLRDRPPGDAESPLRRAIRVQEMAVGGPVARPSRGDRGPALERQARRNQYRLLKRFATRRDLLVGR